MQHPPVLGSTLQGSTSRSPRRVPGVPAAWAAPAVPAAASRLAVLLAQGWDDGDDEDAAAAAAPASAQQEQGQGGKSSSQNHSQL